MPGEGGRAPRAGDHRAERFRANVANASWPSMMRNVEPDHQIAPDWLADFDAAARRPLELRMRYAFIHTYKPVLDDARVRAFETMNEYRQWCERNLPAWLGYGRV